MVTILPKETGWGDAFASIGKGAAQGYQDRTDEMAIQKAIGELPKDYTPRQMLDALTNTKTYSNEPKQRAAKNYLEVSQFEELQAKRTEAESVRKDKEKAAEEKLNRQKNEAKTTIEQSDLPPDQKKAYMEAADRGEFSPASARSATSKPLDTVDYKIAKNQSERFKPAIDHYQKKAIDSEQALPLLETAIMNNERYTANEKLWDTGLDQINSPFLNQFKSKTGQELEAIAPVAISGITSKMGGQLTVARQRLIEKKVAGLGKDKNVNRMLLYMDYFDRKLDQIKAQETNDIIKENKYGLAPSDFDEQLRDRMKPYQKMIAGDIDKLLKDKSPTSPISKLMITQGYNEQLQPGEVSMVDQQGRVIAIPEKDINKPENKDLKRLRL